MFDIKFFGAGEVELCLQLGSMGKTLPYVTTSVVPRARAWKMAEHLGHTDRVIMHVLRTETMVRLDGHVLEAWS